MTALITTFALCAAALLVVAFAYLWFSGAQIIRSRPLGRVEVGWEGGRVEIPATSLTRAPGRYGIWVSTPADDGHLLVGDVIEEDHETGRLARELFSVAGLPDRGQGWGNFTGQLYAGPEAVAPSRWGSVTVAGPDGPCPAWTISPPQTKSALWAIHVHGIGTTRRTALRTVPVADELGMTSLVVSFRGDGEGPPVPGNSSTLGATEWEDVDAAVAFAIAGGATGIVLFAWSMGASAAFLAVERGESRARIRAVVAIAPVTDWVGTVRAGAQRAHLPKFMGSMTAWGLGQTLIARSLGLQRPISLSDLRQATEAAVERLPTLIIHSELDPLVPFATSQRLAVSHPRRVQLRAFQTAGHAWEFNADPAGFNSTISQWLAGLP